MIARLGHSQHPARDLNREPFRGHHPEGSDRILARRTPSTPPRGPAMHRQVGFELTNPTACCREGATLGAAQASLEPRVDPVLAPPVVDRLLRDPKILSDLRAPAAGLDQIQQPTAEPRRISPSRNVVPLEGTTPASSNPAPRNSEQITPEGCSLPHVHESLGAGCALLVGPVWDEPRRRERTNPSTRANTAIQRRSPMR